LSDQQYRRVWYCNLEGPSGPCPTDPSQLDKTFRREFSGRQDLYDDLLKVYRDRRHGLTGLPVRAASELLSKTPEGQQHTQQHTQQASRGPSPMPGGPAHKAQNGRGVLA
jgi:hypothetical protein